jgi:hypothetical protein
MPPKKGDMNKGNDLTEQHQKLLHIDSEKQKYLRT